MHDFSYAAPESCQELYKLLQEKGKKARLLAGGTDLIVDLRDGRCKPEVIVDVKRIPELHKISWNEKDGLSIGASVTIIEVFEHKIVQQKFPLLATAAHHLGSPQLRNRATVVGNLCTASPCADMGCALLALGAEVEIGSSKGKRTLKLHDFFAGVKKTALKDGEAVIRIVVPAESANAKNGMEKIKRIKGHDMAIASVSIMKNAAVLRVGIGSCAEIPLVLKDFAPKASVKEVVEVALKSIRPITDIRATKEFRAAMVQAMIEKIMGNLK